jgi:hypothetical protein
MIKYSLYIFIYVFLFLSKFKNFNSKRNSFCGKFVLGLDIKFELANMIFFNKFYFVFYSISLLLFYLFEVGIKSSI